MESGKRDQLFWQGGRLRSRRQFLLTLGAFGAGTWAAGRAWPLARSLCGRARPADLQIVKRSGVALGQLVSITALHESRSAAEQALRRAFQEFETIEAAMSLLNPQSQLCKLNREGVLPAPHPYLVRVLQKAQAVARATRGSFDVTVQP